MYSYLHPALSFHPVQWSRATSLALTSAQTETWRPPACVRVPCPDRASCPESTSLASSQEEPGHANPAPQCLGSQSIIWSGFVMSPGKCTLNVISYRGNHPLRICRYPIFERLTWEESWTLFCQDSRSSPVAKHVNTGFRWWISAIQQLILYECVAIDWI